MTPDLDAIEARIAAATPGPWSRFEDVRADGQRVWRIGAARLNADVAWTPNYGDADADLIVHAPEDLAALVAEVERLRAVTEAARALIPAGDSDSLTEYAIAWADLRAAFDALDAGGEG